MSCLNIFINPQKKMCYKFEQKKNHLKSNYVRVYRGTSKYIQSHIFMYNISFHICNACRSINRFKQNLGFTIRIFEYPVNYICINSKHDPNSYRRNNMSLFYNYLRTLKE